MRYIRIDRIAPGSVLGNDIFDTLGRMVISRGSVLTEGYIDRLKEHGYAGLYIEDELSSDIEIEPVISPSLRADGMKCVKDMDINKAMVIARDIIDEILEKGVVSLDMADLRIYDDYTYAHSVNVAVLSCIIGIGMGISEKELDNLVLAALLHDLGKMMIPPQILNKKERLTKEEYEIMKTHATESHKLLGNRYDISANTKNAVLFHHENMDGSGYPNGLIGEEIPLLASIIHVADIFDALTSDRPYKKGYAPSEAVEYLMGASGILVDGRIVEYFMRLVPLYQKGFEVVLSDGEKAIVVDNVGQHNMRPIVRLIETGETIDLLARENLHYTIHAGNELDKQEQIESEKARNAMIEKRLTILAVDDMKTNLALIKDILHEEYEVITLDSGQQALLYMTRNPAPDIILMDIDMPILDGIETARRINNMTCGLVPILFVTAICNRETVLKCRALNAAGYIAKPFNNLYIREEIDRIMREWR